MNFHSFWSTFKYLKVLKKHIYIYIYIYTHPGFPGSSNGKESAWDAGDLGLIPGQEDPWRKKWQPTPLFLLGEFHGQRSLVGYSPWGHIELDTTEQLTLSHI